MSLVPCAGRNGTCVAVVAEPATLCPGCLAHAVAPAKALGLSLAVFEGLASGRPKPAGFDLYTVEGVWVLRLQSETRGIVRFRSRNFKNLLREALGDPEFAARVRKHYHERKLETPDRTPGAGSPGDIGPGHRESRHEP